MRVLLISIHVLAAFVLITVVLLQHGKGADIGAAFGGGASQTVFGSRGAGNFLTKMTSLFVVLFMATSVSLAYLSTPRSVIEGFDEAPIEQPESFPGATPIEDEEAADEGGDGVLPEGFEAIPSPGEAAPSSGPGGDAANPDAASEEAPADGANPQQP